MPGLIPNAFLNLLKDISGDALVKLAKNPRTKARRMG